TDLENARKNPVPAVQFKGQQLTPPVAEHGAFKVEIGRRLDRDLHCHKDLDIEKYQITFAKSKERRWVLTPPVCFCAKPELHAGGVGPQRLADSPLAALLSSCRIQLRPPFCPGSAGAGPGFGQA